MNRCLQDMHEARSCPEIRAVKRSIPQRFAAIEKDNNSTPLRVGLLGEATLLRDNYLNHNVEETLGGMGVQVSNFFLLGAELRNIFHIGLWSKHSRAALRRLARPYLKSLVGGHAMDSVAHTIRCAREGYDGVVHVAPTGCMPEITIRPILRRISNDMDIPVLECSFDEHTSHVGFVTRLEAFVDILLDRRKKIA